MAKLLTNSRLRKVTRKITQLKSGWINVFDAVIGKTDGTVNTGVPGEIFVKNLHNGQILAVKNSAVVAKAFMFVKVGARVETPEIWEVLAEREAYTVPSASGFVTFHAPQHSITGPDPVWLDSKQVIQLSVLSQETDLSVKLYGSYVHTKTGDVLLREIDPIDLSSYVPSAGAVWVSIEVDNAGGRHLETGSALGSKAIATPADIPARAWDRYLIAAVLLGEGDTKILNKDIHKPTPLEANYALNAAAFSAILAGIGFIQDAFEALDVHTHADLLPTTRWEPLANGDPAAPALVFDADGDVIMTEVPL